MYKCGSCGLVSQPGEACHMMPVEIRRKAYVTYNKKTKRNKESEGFEIVREIKSCRKCKDTITVHIV